MAMSSPDRIELDAVQRQRLGHLIRAGSTAQHVVERARIVFGLQCYAVGPHQSALGLA